MRSQCNFDGSKPHKRRTSSNFASETLKWFICVCVCGGKRKKQESEKKIKVCIPSEYSFARVPKTVTVNGLTVNDLLTDGLTLLHRTCVSLCVASADLDHPKDAQAIFRRTVSIQ